jgi:hypothetical protein
MRSDIPGGKDGPMESTIQSNISSKTRVDHDGLGCHAYDGERSRKVWHLEKEMDQLFKP